jgi:hypothetical protein
MSKRKLSTNHPSKGTLKLLFKEILEQITPEVAQRLTEEYRKGRTIGFRIMEHRRGFGFKTAFVPFSEGQYVCPTCKGHGEHIAFDTDKSFMAHFKTHCEEAPLSGANKIQEIKEYREKHGCSLKEAVDAVNGLSLKTTATKLAAAGNKMLTTTATELADREYNCDECGSCATENTGMHVNERESAHNPSAHRVLCHKCAVPPTPQPLTQDQIIAAMHATGLFDERGNYIGHQIETDPEKTDAHPEDVLK